MVKIHEFNPQIYPFKLWVAINPDFKTLDRTFYFLNKDKQVVDVREEDLSAGNSIARTFPIAHKIYGTAGVLVCIYKLKLTTTGIIAHESCHCADFMAEELGFTERGFDNGEPFAYLVGWIADCIEKAKKFKKKRKSK